MFFHIDVYLWFMTSNIYILVNLSFIISTCTLVVNSNVYLWFFISSVKGLSVPSQPVRTTSHTSTSNRKREELEVLKQKYINTQILDLPRCVLAFGFDDIKRGGLFDIKVNLP